MRGSKLLALAIPLLTGLPQAYAIGVGDAAPCVVLNQISPNGSESEHCIRDAKSPNQSKILEFFSATCSDCAANLPIVSHLASDVENVATTRLVGIDRNETLMRDYVKANANLIHFEVALDPSRDAKRAYDIFDTPTIFVLDSTNKVTYRHEGVLSPADVQNIKAVVNGAQ